MSEAALPADRSAAQAAPITISIGAVQRTILWLLVASGAFASIEPSPYEIFFVLAVLAFGLRGLSFDRSLIPLIVGLALFSVGGALALVPLIPQRESTILD